MNLPVSVIIPCYKSKNTIVRALDSVLRQKSKPSEIIIIDDSSHDGTLEFINQIAIKCPIPVLVLSNSENKGPAFCRNLGIEISSYPYLAFLDADDSWHELKLGDQYRIMKKYDADLCGHKININSSIKARQIKLDQKKIIKVIGIYDLLFHNYFSTPSVMLKRDLTYKFDVKMKRCEDYDMWLKLSFQEKKSIYIDWPYGNVYKDFYGASGLSKSLILMEFYELKSIFRYLFKLNILLVMAALLYSMAKFIRRFTYIYIKKLLIFLNLN